MPINKHTLSSIKEKYLWFSKMADFNDPYEGQVRIDHNYTAYELESFIKERREILTDYDIQKLLTNADEYIIEGMKKAYEGERICCFTTSSDNMLMWSHYADNHKGLCLKFDITEDSTGVFKTLFPVQYTNIRESCNYIRDSLSYIRRAALTKSMVWRYENEYRAICPILSNQRFPFDIKMLKGVIFGCKIDKNIMETVIKLLPPHVETKLCHLNEYEFKIDLLDISA